MGGPGGHGIGLVDHGIHLIDIFSWILDSEVNSVFGQGNISGGRPASEFAVLNFANGAVGQLIANGISYPAALPGHGIFSWGGRWTASGELNMKGGWDSHPGSFQIYGDTGALNVYHYAEKLYRIDAAGVTPVRLDRRPMPGNFALQMESFAHSIIHDLPPEVPGEVGLRSLRALQAVYESFATGRLVHAVAPPHRLAISRGSRGSAGVNSKILPRKQSSALTARRLLAGLEKP